MLLHFTGGVWGTSPRKIWNLDPLRLILTQFRVKIHNQTHVHIQYESRWLFNFITLTKGNGGREGGKVQRWDGKFGI